MGNFEQVLNCFYRVVREGGIEQLAELFPCHQDFVLLFSRAIKLLAKDFLHKFFSGLRPFFIAFSASLPLRLVTIFSACLEGLGFLIGVFRIGGSTGFERPCMKLSRLRSATLFPCWVGYYGAFVIGGWVYIAAGLTPPSITT
jgi:hypothetical protein